MDKSKIPGRTWVYALADEHERVKIGIADDLNKRRSQYKTHNPDELSLIFSQSCTQSKARSIELYAHNVLSSNKKHGEWFNETSGNTRRAILKGMKKCGQLNYDIWAHKGVFSISSRHVSDRLFDQSMEDIISGECLDDLGGIKIKFNLEPGDEKKIRPSINRQYTFKKSRHSDCYVHTIICMANFKKPFIVDGKKLIYFEMTKKIEQEFTVKSAFQYVESIFAKHLDPQ